MQGFGESIGQDYNFAYSRHAHGANFRPHTGLLPVIGNHAHLNT
jgi:hypothetical protein